MRGLRSRRVHATEKSHGQFDSLTLTGARRGATNRGIGPLVVSLLPHCGPHNASEAAALPGRAGCIAAEGSSGNTPSTPGGENFVFSPPHLIYPLDSCR
jgi:hypothetical protein